MRRGQQLLRRHRQQPPRRLLRGTNLLNALSSMLVPFLQLLLIMQVGILVGYYISLPDIKGQVTHLRRIFLHQIRVGQYDVESFASARVRQMQDAIRAQRAFAGFKDDTASASAKEFDLSLDVNGGITGLSRILERVIDDLAATTGPLKSCFEYGQESIVSLSPNCKSAEVARSQRTMVVFNPYPKKRKWCGHEIEPGQVVSIKDITECEEDWMNLAVFPPPSLADAPDADGIEIVTSNYYGEPELRRYPNCDVSCAWKGAPYGTFRIAGTKWQFTQSAEGPQYYEELVIDPSAHLNDQYYSTTSFRSEIPLPYFSWTEYDIKTKPVQYDDVIKGASFIANNCGSRNDRESIVTGIIDSGFRVDSLSACLHNAEPPNGLSMDNKRELMRQYLFHLAFENQNEDDYITEKLWGALEAGIVPVYLGAPNIKEHVPKGSIIAAADFDTPKALGDYLANVASDRTLYEQYHAWREDVYPNDFVKKYNFTNIHSECRTCRWAYAKKKGLGWDHEQQRITALRLPREVCTDGVSGMVTRPIKESYLTYDVAQHRYEDAQTHRSISGRSSMSGYAQAASMQHGMCSKRGLQSPFLFTNYEIERSIVEHDNVIDIIIEIKHRHMHEDTTISPLFLRLETILQANRAYFTATDHRGEVARRTFNGDDTAHWQTTNDGMRYILIQDRDSRITVWTDWQTQMLSPLAGTIDILLSGETYAAAAAAARRAQRRAEVTYRKIRVIVEDSNQLHYDENEGSPTYFARNMAKDLYHPLELFYVDG